MTTPLALKKLQNGAALNIAINIDWNDQTKWVARNHDNTQNYLYISCAKFDILNHEGFPDIGEKVEGAETPDHWPDQSFGGLYAARVCIVGERSEPSYR